MPKGARYADAYLVCEPPPVMIDYSGRFEAAGEQATVLCPPETPYVWSAGPISFFGDSGESYPLAETRSPTMSASGSASATPRRVGLLLRHAYLPVAAVRVAAWPARQSCRPDAQDQPPTGTRGRLDPADVAPPTRSPEREGADTSSRTRATGCPSRGQRGLDACGLPMLAGDCRTAVGPPVPSAVSEAA